MFGQKLKNKFIVSNRIQLTSFIVFIEAVIDLTVTYRIDQFLIDQKFSPRMVRIGVKERMVQINKANFIKNFV